MCGGGGSRQPNATEQAYSAEQIRIKDEQAAAGKANAKLLSASRRKRQQRGLLSSDALAQDSVLAAAASAPTVLDGAWKVSSALQGAMKSASGN